MKAMAVDDYGAPATLREVPAPTPGDDQVSVRVAFSSVNGFDLAVANGYLKGAMDHRFPVVLGKDVAGSVEATGPEVQSLEWLAAEVVAGRLTVPIERTYPLAEVPRALADFASGKRGKLSIQIT